MRALPVRQLPVELRIPQRWSLALVLMQVLPERTLASLAIRVRREILPVLVLRTLASPVQVRRVPMLELLELRVLRVLRVRTPDSPVIRVRQERFLERAQPVVRRVRPEAVRVAVPLNSKPVPLRTRC